MWVPVPDEAGRIYYYHTHSFETTWDNPLKNMLNETQSFAEDVWNVAKQQRLNTVLNICHEIRVKRVFRVWLRNTSSSITSLINAMDAWMKARDQMLYALHTRDELQTTLNEERLTHKEVARELASERVRNANIEFERLVSRCQHYNNRERQT